MNKKYSNKNFRSFLLRHIKSPLEFAHKYGYNSRNMRRWLFYKNLFPRPPAIAQLVLEISEYYKIPLMDLVLECFQALILDYQEFRKNNP